MAAPCNPKCFVRNSLHVRRSQASDQNDHIPKNFKSTSIRLYILQFIYFYEETRSGNVLECHLNSHIGLFEINI